METVVMLAALAAGLGAFMWRTNRTERRQLASAFDGDAEVVLHVAGHEARTRGQPVSTYHLLYGLLQDETVIEAIRSAGHDPDALEDRVLAALDRQPTGAVYLTDDASVLLSHAAAAANHHQRRAGAKDLAVHALHTDLRPMLDEAGWVTVAFILVHGGREPEIGHAAGDVNIVLRNDDFTTMEFVKEALREVFELGDAEADARMMTTHTAGRAVIGRYRLDQARAKIDEVRRLAHAAGYPLWIGVEPV